MRIFINSGKLYLLSSKRIKRGDYVVSIKGYNVGDGIFNKTCCRGTVTMDGFDNNDIGIDKAARVKRSCFRRVIRMWNLSDIIFIFYVVAAILGTIIVTFIVLNHFIVH